MRYHPIPVRLFMERRQAFAKKMNRDAIAIFYSNDPMPRSGDQYYPFRQDSALFSLSGLDQAGTIIVLQPGASRKEEREFAFILKPDPKLTVWNGKRYSVKEARNISGIQTIKTIDQWDRVMSPVIGKASMIYMNYPESKQSHREVLSQNDRMTSMLKNEYPHHSFQSAQPILRQLSMIKHPIEIDLIHRAIEVTGLAFDRVMRTIRPKMIEYEVEAELTYILTQNGCHHAFEPIVASGKSACTLHYTRNDKLIHRDSLVLIDFGAEYANMASDMTRTIPASGKFSKRQKKIYSAVLNVLNEVTGMMRPGIKLDQLNAEAGKLIESELTSLRLLTKKEIRLQQKGAPLWKKYFMHGISHHLGYDVHDLSEKTTPLSAGMILTCEPGIYIPEESIGIRLENDILITRKGPKNLMEHIPIDPDEIESIMHSG